MTDEHVTATSPYKGQYSTAARVGNPQTSSQVNRQTRSARLQHPQGVLRPKVLGGGGGVHWPQYHS